MKEIHIGENESNQRVDRFLKKYFHNAPNGFIFKMIRKKRIKLNGKKVSVEDLLKEGDILELYLAEETIDKFSQTTQILDIKVNLNIIYEDDNIILINKPKGVLSQPSSNEDKNSVVSQLISYLYQKGEYNPQVEKTFTPAICNRLDRNTSGIIIGAKNFHTLQDVNETIRNGGMKKYYKTIVKGLMDSDMELSDYLIKDKENNKVFVEKEKGQDHKEIKTNIKVLKRVEGYSLLEIDLITGRTHQIRAHLSSINHPIIGDPKYGDPKINRIFKRQYDLRSQILHGYRIILNGFSSKLEYLNKKEFIADSPNDLKKIEKDIFG